MQKLGWDGFDLLNWGSLLGGYRSSAALEPLVRSGRLLGSSTARRTSETSTWFLAVIDDDGLRRDGAGWQLSVHVRVMHAFVNYQLEQDPTLGLGAARHPDQPVRPGEHARGVLDHAPAAGAASRPPGESS